VTTPPSRLSDRALDIAWRLLAAAVVTYITVRIVETILPVLLGIGIVALVIFAAWRMYAFRRSRW
jgi:hypothetical protein